MSIQREWSKITIMEIRSSYPPQARRHIAASRNGDERREQRDADIARLAAQRDAREQAQARRAGRRRQAEQTERRLQGRLVTDARHEAASRVDDASRVRVMRERVRAAYREQERNRVEQDRQAELRRHQAEQARRNPIDLVV